MMPWKGTHSSYIREVGGSKPSLPTDGPVAELAYAAVLKTAAREGFRVRAPAGLP